MSGQEPTTRLRFVQRWVPAPELSDPASGQYITKQARILQQWWAYACGSCGEWRDVSFDSDAAIDGEGEG